MIKNQAEQDETRGPSLALPVFVRRNGVNIDHVRKRVDGLVPAGAPEAIAEGGEEERSGFAGDASEGEKDGGEDAAIGGGDDDGGDRLPLAGAESHGAFAQRARDGAQELFGAAQRDGNHHDAESESAGERGEMLEGKDDESCRRKCR